MSTHTSFYVSILLETWEEEGELGKIVIELFIS